MEDYIVVFDEAGQPYIAHFSLKGAYNKTKGYVAGVGRGVRANHKYIAKIGNRYIYDAKELAAAKANQYKSNKQVRKDNQAKNKRHKEFTKIKSAQDKQTNKARKDYQKQKNRDENYNQVTLSTYITGGYEKQNYKQNKKDYNTSRKEMNKAKKDYQSSVKRADKLRTSDSQNEVIDRRKAYERSINNAAKARQKMELSEKKYEETSLSGAARRKRKEAKKKAKALIKKIGNTPVYVAKGK